MNAIEVNTATAIPTYSDGGTCRRFSVELDTGVVRAYDPVDCHYSVAHSLTPRQEAILVRRAQIAYWKSLIPADLQFGTFEPRFKVGNQSYKYGAWNGLEPWLYWNTTAELLWQLSQIDE